MYIEYFFNNNNIADILAATALGYFVFLGCIHTQLLVVGLVLFIEAILLILFFTWRGE